MYFLEKNYREENVTMQITNKELRVAAFMGIAVYAVSNISYAFQQTPFSSQFPAEIFIIRTLADLGGVCMLFAYHMQLQELQAVCTRYVIAMSRLEKATPKVQYLLLLQAIGEETIFREILEQHPALTQRPVVDREAFLRGILQIKALMKYSNDTLAEKLSVSRTTIWRILQDTAPGGEES